MAYIENRGNLQWRAQVRRKGYPTTCKTFETKADAEKWARMIESEMDRGVFVSRRESEKYTLSECLDRFIEEYIPNLKKADNEIARAKRLQKRKIAHRIMASIRAKDIADFKREREAEGSSGNTIRLDLALLSRLFNYARSDWGMESLQNPVQLVTKPKIAKGRERRFEGKEEENLLKACPQPFSYVVRFALETAMRREEISLLTWDNVDLENRSVHLPMTKNGESRTVPLSPVAIELLKEVRANNDNSLSVFNMSPSAITQAMEKARNKAKIENLRFHDLRHEATSRLFENTDLDLMEIRAITGHKTMQMLARYTHLRTARLADRLAGATRTSKKEKEE
jgi:Site-specific recombinase XerD